MKFEEENKNIIIKNVRNFDLDQTFECGQCFRWKKTSGKYQGVAFGKELTVFSRGCNLILENTSKKDFEKIWSKYFDLNTDYGKISKELSKISSTLKKAGENYSGIRILRQDPWETLCSFIISQNNNIPRIKGIISRFCENFGEKINENFCFPKAQMIAKLLPGDLSPLRCGFRAKYIIDAAKKTAGGEIDFKRIAKMPIFDARRDLMKVSGVGPKVADCTLLFGFGKLEVFPLDVWMKKVMSAFFQGKSPEIFGKYAGVAQQYLFHYARSNPEILRTYP